MRDWRILSRFFAINRFTIAAEPGDAAEREQRMPESATRLKGMTVFRGEARVTGAGTIVAFALLAVIVSSAIGCNRVRQDYEIYVPQQETAIDQFKYAVNYKNRYELILRGPDRNEKFFQSRAAVREVFAKVVELFPEDRMVTPLAKLELADMKAGLDVTRIEPSRPELLEAAQMLRQLQEEYPDYPYVQGKALFDEGRVWLKLEDYPKAQEAFRRVIEDYKAHEDERLQMIARMANMQYQRTYVK